MLTSKQRSILTGLAAKDCVVLILGKNGLTDALVSRAGELLSHHELIKVKFIDFKDEKQALAEELAARNSAELVRVIGNNALIYRQNSDPEKRQIALQ